jgi:hypothetical protein
VSILGFSLHPVFFQTKGINGMCLLVGDHFHQF